MAEPVPAVPSKRRKRFGSSLRVLIVIVLLLGGGMGWLAYQARAQREAVAEIEAAGGKIYYDLDWECGEDVPTPRKPRWPKWFVDRLGPDYLGHVIAVEFRRGPSNHADDKVMGQISRLSTLESLDLGAFDSVNDSFSEKCKVTDAGLGHLRGLDRLRRIGLHHTSVRGSGLTHLSGLRCLRKLYLEGIPISDEAALGLAPLPFLEELTVDSAVLTDAGLVRLAPLKQLKRLHLRARKVSAVGFDQLVGWSRLECLALWTDGVQDYRFLSQFPELRSLHLYLTNQAILISDLHQLKRSHADLSKQGNLGLDSLETLPKLRDLSLVVLSYPDSLLSHIGRLEKLEKLDLHLTANVPKADYRHLARLVRLESLSLMGRTVDDSAIAHLSSLHRLKSLRLAFNPITDAGLAHVSGLTELEILNMDSTKITDAGLIHLVFLKKCKKLTVANSGVTINGFSAYRAKQEAQ